MHIHRARLLTHDRLELDPDRTAVVIMDFQIGIVGNASDPDGTVDRAGAVLAAARAAGARVIYVMHRGGRFEADSPDVEIHPGVTPIEGETVLRKIRVGSFCPRKPWTGRALAKAAISSARSSRLGLMGLFPANSTTLNSQLLSSANRNWLLISSSLYVIG